MKVTHRVERQLVGELQAHHDHSRDPEEQNVVAWKHRHAHSEALLHAEHSHAHSAVALHVSTCLQHAVGVERLKVRVLGVGPAEGGEREQAG